MPTNKEIKKNALRVLKMSRLETLNLSIVTICLGGVSLFAFTCTEATIVALSSILRSGSVSGNLGTFLWWTYIVVAVYLLLSILVGSFVELGYDRLLLLKLKEQRVGDGVLFAFKKYWSNAVMLRLYMAMKSILWMIILLVPGIVAIINYALAPYVIAQFPHLRPPDAVEMSKVLMKGYRIKLVLLILSFMDEIIISLFALGLPLFYVIPRIKVCIAEFYRERVALHDEQLRQIARQAARSR